MYGGIDVAGGLILLIIILLYAGGSAVVAFLNIAIPIFIAVIVLLFLIFYIKWCIHWPKLLILIPIVATIVTVVYATYTTKLNQKKVNLYVAQEECSYYLNNPNLFQSNIYTEVNQGTLIAKFDNDYYIQDSDGYFYEVDVVFSYGIKNMEYQETMTYKEFKEENKLIKQ